MPDDDRSADSGCPHCFGPVHPDATRCRHCGAQLVLPWWRTSRGTLLIGAVVGLVLVAVLVTRAMDDADKHAADCVEALRAGKTITADDCGDP